MSIPDHDAAHYTRHSSLQNSHAQDVLSVCQVSSKDKVLDVGCGDGGITFELARRAQEGDVIGLDASPSMIKFASEHFPENQFPNLHFQLVSIEEAVFPHPFNLITSFSCFHWLKKPKIIMEKLISALEEDGELLILTYPKESPYYQYLEKALEKYPDYKDLSANCTMLSAQEYNDFFLSKHLKVLNFEEKTIFAEYNNDVEIFNFIKGWVSNYVPIPCDLQDQFINDVIQAILDDPAIEKDPVIKVPYTALTMRVQK